MEVSVKRESTVIPSTLIVAENLGTYSWGKKNALENMDHFTFL